MLSVLHEYVLGDWVSEWVWFISSLPFHRVIPPHLQLSMPVLCCPLPERKLPQLISSPVHNAFSAPLYLWPHPSLSIALCLTCHRSPSSLSSCLFSVSGSEDSHAILVSTPWVDYCDAAETHPVSTHILPLPPCSIFTSNTPCISPQGALLGIRITMTNKMQEYKWKRTSRQT